MSLLRSPNLADGNCLNARVVSRTHAVLARRRIQLEQAAAALALLAYLAVTRQSHSRESLAALFWPDYDQSRAHAYLRRTSLASVGDPAFIVSAIADAVGFSFFSQSAADDQPMQKRQLLNLLS